LRELRSLERKWNGTFLFKKKNILETYSFSSPAYLSISLIRYSFLIPLFFLLLFFIPQHFYFQFEIAFFILKKNRNKNKDMGSHSFLWHQASFYGIQKRTAGEERVRRQEKIWKEKLERRERERKKEMKRRKRK
jgi:hypothetical protein